MKKIPVRHIAENKKELPSTERFSIRDVGELLGGEDLFHDLHRHDFFFILLLKKGAGIHEIDFISHDIADHSIFFLRPGQVHQLTLKAGAAGFIMEFNAGFYQPATEAAARRFRKISNKNFCQTDGGRFEKLFSISGNILQEYREKNEDHLDAIKAGLDIFFIELLRQSEHPKVSPGNSNRYTQHKLEEFLSFLEEHITTKKQVAQYTDLMNLSAYQLNEITKSSIGKTASELISEQILLEAKRYLLATHNQIKEIADQLGYEDVSYFIRFFKKHTGHSPETFRQHFK
jgi:AraC family transcriptional activator of pobA